MAGPRLKSDPRNYVIAAVARRIVELQPEAAVIENVAALASQRHSIHLSKVLRLLRRGGYSVIPLLLDAAEFGVAQVRQRVICVATKVPLDRDALEATLAEYRTTPQTVRQALTGLRRPPIYRGPHTLDRAAVPNHVAMNHSEQVRRKISNIKPGEGPMSYRRLRADRPARTLISGNRAPPVHPVQHRSITVREAARLQGFPDSFRVYGTFANQMLHVTNAVPPPLATCAIGAMLNLLDDQ